MNEEARHIHKDENNARYRGCFPDRVGSQLFEQVKSFVYYFGCRVTKDCANEVRSSNEVRSRLAIGTATADYMVKLVKVWMNKSVSNNTKLWLVGTSMWPIATYGCEAWMLKKQKEIHIQAVENECIKKMIRISWTKMTNESVHELAEARSVLLKNVRARKITLLSTHYETTGEQY